MTAFGPLLRSYRQRAGLGLRTFAGLIDERASAVSAVESGRRAPWRHADRLRRVAEVLGIVETSNFWEKFVELAHHDPQPSGVAAAERFEGQLLWWWTTEHAPPVDLESVSELAEFLGTSTDSAAHDANGPFDWPEFTELAIEWQVRRLLGRRSSQVVAAPIDVEAVLENEAQVRLEIVPGLVPRFSVQACVLRTSAGMTLVVDRIIADSRPLASYRHLLANCFAPAALWNSSVETASSVDWFIRLRSSSVWSQVLRDCQRFALALLLPADPVLAGSESAYRELVEQQGWVEPEVGARCVRNRLAEQFAVPPKLVHRRLVGWPCHLYGRIAQALTAEELTLPPTDWLIDEASPRQRTLFDIGTISQA